MSSFDPRPLDPRIAELLSDYPDGLFSERFYQSVEWIDRYGLDLVIQVLQQLDAVAPLRSWCSVNRLCRERDFSPRFRNALGWLLERLADAGYLAINDEHSTRCYRLQGDLPTPDLVTLKQVGLALDPANAATLDLLDAAAAVYPSVAQGASGAEALFGMSEIQRWLAYFSNNNPLYAINNWVAAIAAADCVADNTSLRVLEIGAGACSGTEAVLRTFAERGMTSRLERYLVTEPNPFFRRRGEKALKRNFPNLPLEFGTLDMDQSWEQQGAANGAFDLVYAVNVLHSAHDLLFALEQARRSLAKGGQLVLGECLRPVAEQPIYIELVFQIMDSFTEVVTDAEIRPQPGFLTPDCWRRALSRAEFTNVTIKPDPERDAG
ncbi:MAG: class I SAM-dependent methyltransferase, partial [Candidatus Competibacteraceae bacterium]|nr:class I SAM-dependent methyltransferase [Candidatus Competibacteraceae bacterium]